MSTRGRPKKRELAISVEDRRALERLVKARGHRRDEGYRARIVLLSAQGLTNTEISRRVGGTLHTVGKWRDRFIEAGILGLQDEPRVGAPRKVGDEKIAQLIRATLESKPAHATHWSTRGMAKKLGMSQTMVSRVWRAFGLKPHRSEAFQLSNDPEFVEKVRDVVGLYLSPPANAVVLSVDEKSQIQALSRSQPVLPMRIGSVERQTHDYQRHGTTSLFAALDVATGNVIGKCYPRHRAKEFVSFLRLIENATPAEREIHLILDNYATHKTLDVKKWLLKNPRVHLHFIPTHSSWLNQVERWFALLTERQIKRGSHSSVKALEAAISSFLAATNKEPRPFVWTATADKILTRVASFANDTLLAHS